MRAADVDTPSLPEDAATLRALLIETLAQVGTLVAERDALASQNERLQHLLLKLKRHQFGTKSERLPEEQLLFAFEEIEATLAENAAEAGKASPTLRDNQAKRRRAGRGRLPAHLPRIELVLAPEASACPCCQGPLVEIGVDAAERLDVIPAQFRVVVTKHPKLACRACPGVVLQEPARARLVEAGIATETLQRIAALYAVETDLRGTPPESRPAGRQKRSRPLVEALFAWLSAQLARLPGGNPTAGAIRYALNHRDGLVRFLEDGRIELDNNTVKRAIRPICLSRKNALFASGDDGWARWAAVASLVETCKLNGVDPQRYFAEILTSLVNGWPNVSARRGPPTVVGLNLSCDPTGVLWSAVKDGGGWRDGNHHRGGAASSLAARGKTADPC